MISSFIEHWCDHTSMPKIFLCKSLLENLHTNRMYFSPTHWVAYNADSYRVYTNNIVTLKSFSELKMKNSVHGEFKEVFLGGSILSFEFLIGFYVISWIVVWKSRLYMRKYLQIPERDFHTSQLLKQCVMNYRKFSKTIRVLNIQHLL